MRPVEELKRLIENARIRINPEVKEAGFEELVKELEKSKITDSADRQRNIWIMIAKIRVIHVAAVLIVLSTIYLLTLGDKGQTRQHQIDETEIAVISKTPDKLLSVFSLNMALRDGGIEAVMKQFQRAHDQLKPELRKRSANEQLIYELEEYEKI